MTTATRPAFAPLERDTMQERVYVELRQALMRVISRPARC